MPMGILFWVLMLLWLVFGLWRSWGDHYAMGGSVLQFILFLLIGWHTFGPPIR